MRIGIQFAVVTLCVLKISSQYVVLMVKRTPMNVFFESKDVRLEKASESFITVNVDKEEVCKSSTVIHKIH